MDAGKHFIGGVVTTEFLQFSKERGKRMQSDRSAADEVTGNDLTTRRGGFPGLKDGCRWCLCVDR
jgi:hypothetical protein